MVTYQDIQVVIQRGEASGDGLHKIVSEYKRDHHSSGCHLGIVLIGVPAAEGCGVGSQGTHSPPLSSVIRSLSFACIGDGVVSKRSSLLLQTVQSNAAVRHGR